MLLIAEIQSDINSRCFNQLVAEMQWKASVQRSVIRLRIEQHYLRTLISVGVGMHLIKVALGNSQLSISTI
jgi:hypothetical protein